MAAESITEINPAILFKVIYQRESGEFGDTYIKDDSEASAAFHVGADLREEFPDERLYFVEIRRIS